MDRHILGLIFVSALLQTFVIVYTGAQTAVHNSSNETNCTSLTSESDCCKAKCAWCLPKQSGEGNCEEHLNQTTAECNNSCQAYTTTVESVTTLETTTTNATSTMAPTSTSAAPSTSGNTPTSTEVKSSTGPTTNATIVSTEAPTTTEIQSTVPTTASAPCPPQHSFDAASFIGGIVLGLGVITISCFVYRWYQNKYRPGAPYHQF